LAKKLFKSSFELKTLCADFPNGKMHFNHYVKMQLSMLSPCYYYSAEGQESCVPTTSMWSMESTPFCAMTQSCASPILGWSFGRGRTTFHLWPCHSQHFLQLWTCTSLIHLFWGPQCSEGRQCHHSPYQDYFCTCCEDFILDGSEIPTIQGMQCCCLPNLVCRHLPDILAAVEPLQMNTWAALPRLLMVGRWSTRAPMWTRIWGGQWTQVLLGTLHIGGIGLSKVTSKCKYIWASVAM
jgi:hypothetical protein